MRWWLVLPFLLAGCLDGAPETTDDIVAEPVPLPVLEGPVVLIEATVPWHMDGTPVGDAVGLYAMAAQPVARPCLWDDGPYFNNLPLSAKAGMRSVPAGAAALEIVLEWTEADYLGDKLAIAYRENSSAAWKESPYVGNGEALVLEVPPAGPGDDAEEERAPRNGSGWSLWACVSRGDDDTPTGSEWSPMPFTGELTARVTALPVDDSATSA